MQYGNGRIHIFMLSVHVPVKHIPMKMNYSIALILLAAAFAGCTSNKCQVSCIGDIGIMAVGFTRAELDSASCMKYKRNGEFNTLVGSGTLNSVDWKYPSINDTLLTH